MTLCHCGSDSTQEAEEEEERQRKALAAQKLAQLRRAGSKGSDRAVCRVADGLFVGGIGAARNLKALRKAGVTHILNCSPAVPCFFRDNPEGAFIYHTVPIFDEASADMMRHVPASNAFIAEGRRAGGVLVHCFAGQSRSAAFVMAHLMAGEGMALGQAWAAVRAARPCAAPNAGFLAQLAAYERALEREPTPPQDL